MSASFIDNVTVLILTYNEAANIGRTLAKLKPLRRVVVIDSGSDDGTSDIIASHENARIIVRAFDTHAAQWNFGLTEAGIESEWVLALDADYVLSDELVTEIAGLAPAGDIAGYRARFRYCVLGKAIRSGVYPPVVLLFRKSRGRYVQDGHTQRLVVDGGVADLESTAYHDDRKSLARWLESQSQYAKIEADHLQRTDRAKLSWQDRVRLMIGVAPPLTLLYVFVLRGGFLDGWRGFYYALQRAYAELLLSLELLDRRLRRFGGP